MQFCIKEWRKIYDEVQRIGKILKDSYPSFDDQKRLVPPVAALSPEAQKGFQEEIKKLMEKNNNYLDACGIKPREPLWKYNKDDKKTWPSDESFTYGHLLKGRKCKIPSIQNARTVK